MNEPLQPQHNEKFELLNDWSKWLITINFAAATGCTIVLQKAVENNNEALIQPLHCAIIMFACSVLIAVVLVFLIAIGAIRALMWSFPLALLQLISFIFALYFFGCWVNIKSFQKPKEKKPEPACCITCKPA